MIRGLFGRSGGIGYHLIALRYAKRLWAPFRNGVSRELAARIPGGPDRHLLIIGSSGGYCLDPSYLETFGAVTAYDIDPLAGWILRRRFAREIRFLKHDFFSELESLGWDLEKWCTRFAPTDALRPVLLFSNLLGQLEILFGEKRNEEISRGLAKALRESRLPWATVHDRVSLPVKHFGVFSRRTETPLSSEDLARSFLDWRSSLVGGGSERRLPSPLVVEEHGIGEWQAVASKNCAYLNWPITPYQTQLIEILSSSSSSEFPDE